MYKSFLSYWLGLFLVLLFSSWVQAQEEYIHFTIRDGLPSNTVYCVEQDETGFMWFGTDAGLSRYDGYEFRNFGLEDGLPDVEILNFYKDSFGRIWFYTLNGKVGFLLNGKIHNSSNTEFLEGKDFDSRITSVQERDGVIFISGLRDGIRIFDEVGDIEYMLNQSPGYHYIYLNDNEWYYFNSYNNSALCKKGSISSLTKGLYYERVKLSELELLAASNGYALPLDEGFLTFPLSSSDLLSIDLKAAEIRKESLPGWDESRINNIKKIADRIILLGSSGVFELTTTNYANPEIVYSVQEATSFYTDGQGNNWITTLKSGIRLIYKSEIGFVGTNKIGSIQSMYSHSDTNSLILINRKGEVWSLSNQEDQFKFLYKLPISSIWTLQMTKSGQLSILSTEGLFVDGKKKLSHLKPRSRSSLYQDLYIYPSFKEIHIIDINENNQQTIDFSIEERIRNLFPISPSKLLLTIGSGLHCLDIEKLEIYKYLEWDGIWINAIEMDKHNYIWFATNGDGLLRINKDSVDLMPHERILATKIEDLNDRVLGDLEILDSIIYVSSPSGISKITHDQYTPIDFSHIGEAYGIPPGKTNAIQSYNGKIYLARDNGLFSFNHESSFEESSDFPVLIDEFNVDNSVLYNLSKIELSHKVNLIQITTKALNYRFRNSLKYQFKLNNGEDPTSVWLDMSTNQISFANLPPNTYTFKVRAKTKNSDWTKPSQLSFTIFPAYWQTWWFRVLIGLLSIAVISLVLHRINISKEEKRDMQKEKLLSDLKALKAQINPHFLFNSLNSIQSFVLEGKDYIAEDYLVKYAKLMRKILNHSNVLTIVLAEELETIDLYVDLEKIRLSKKLNFIVSLDESIDTSLAKVPSMIIQPLIENAIWHGIQPSDRDGELKLELIRKNDQIEVSLIDNGIGFDLVKSADINPHGLNIVKERIEILNRIYDIKSSLDIASDGNGASVIFRYSSEIS